MSLPQPPSRKYTASPTPTSDIHPHPDISMIPNTNTNMNTATYFGGLTNNPDPSLNPYTPVSITQAPVAKTEDYEKSTKWYEKMKRKLCKFPGKFRNEFKDSGNKEGENKHNKAIIFWGTIIILVILVVIFVPIGVYYHAPEHRTNKGTPTTSPTSASVPTTRVKYTDPANVIMATIPGAFADGDDIDVMIEVIPESKSEAEAQPKSKPKAKAKAKSDNTQVLNSRTLRTRTGIAPPYFDSCKINQDCGWGYRCIENTCYPGCDSDDDCRKEHKCGHWKHDGPSDMYCMVKPHKDCRLHLDFCAADNDCCSGRCERVNGKKWRLCVPGIGRLDDSDLGLEEGEV